MAEFVPKAIINCYNTYLEDSEKGAVLSDFQKELKYLFKNNDLGDYIKYYNYRDLHGFKKEKIDTEIKALRSNESVKLPGEKRTDKKLSYICIIIMDSEDESKKIKKLKTIKQKTEFDRVDLGYNYVVIDRNSSSDLPLNNFMQIKMRKENENGNKVNDSDYYRNILDTVKTISLLDTSQLKNKIFNQYPENIISLNSKVISYLDKRKKEKIDNFLLKSVYQKLLEDTETIRFNNLFSENKLEKEDKFPNKQFIKIPLISTKKGREKRIWIAITKHSKVINKELNNRLEKQPNFNLDENKESNTILTKLMVEIKEYIKRHYNPFPLKKALIELKNELKSQIKSNKKKYSWNFIKRPDCKISGFPFNAFGLILTILFFICGLLVYFLGGFKGSLKEYYFFILFGSYISLMLIISFIYLKNRKSRLKKILIKFSHDGSRFLQKNKEKYLSTNQNYQKRILIDQLNNDITRYKLLENSIENRYSGLKKMAKLENEELEIVNKKISNKIAEIITETLKEFGEEIYSSITDIRVFENYILLHFHESKIYQNIKKEFRKKIFDEIDYGETFKNLDTLPIDENGIGKRYKILVRSNNTEIEGTDKDGVQEIELVIIEDFLSFLSLGVISNGK